VDQGFAPHIAHLRADQVVDHGFTPFILIGHLLKGYCDLHFLSILQKQCYTNKRIAIKCIIIINTRSREDIKYSW
jgi:hypothetical protein